MELTIFLLKKYQEARCEVISETPHSLGQLMSINGTRSVLVKVTENTLPITDVLPKPLEFF